MIYRVIFTLALALTAAHLVTSTGYAQELSCGVVDAIDYPLDISDTIERRFDDFARFRRRFDGLHVGFDLAFNRYGEPVRAAARGRVTLSDAEEWDTEKGVVIIQHVFPDGSIVYTVYGHLEPHPAYNLPRVGSCVGRGDVIGAIGDPSMSLPHLHYEIRRFMPDDGGPGYIQENPLLNGWYHPLEFTQLWRARLTGAVLGSVEFDLIPAVPPIFLDNGLTIIGSGSTLEALLNGNEQWRVNTSGSITGLLALPQGRIIARSRPLNGANDVLRGSSPAALFAAAPVFTITPNSPLASGATPSPEPTLTPSPTATFTLTPDLAAPQTSSVVTVQNGRYLARWEVTGQDFPFYAFTADGRETLVFAGENGAILAFDPTGASLWRLDAPERESRIIAFTGGINSVSAVIRSTSGIMWQVVDASGAVTYQTQLDQAPIVAPLPNGDWLMLNGTTINRVQNNTVTPLATISPPVGRAASMIGDSSGMVYVYMGDADMTLLAAAPDGSIRWRIRYPFPVSWHAPLMAVGGGCILYTLDADGMLNLFNTLDGSLINQAAFYAGGESNTSPNARILRADAQDRVLVGAGFLSLSAIDGRMLAGAAGESC